MRSLGVAVSGVFVSVVTAWGALILPEDCRVLPVNGTDRPGASVDVVRESACVRIKYDYTNGGGYVGAAFSSECGFCAKAVRFTADYPRDVTTFLRAIDATGQTFQFANARILPDGRTFFNLTEPAFTSWGGAGDRCVHQPFKVLQFIVRNSYYPEPGKRGEARITTLECESYSSEELVWIGRFCSGTNLVVSEVSDFGRGACNRLDPLPYKTEGGTLDCGKVHADFSKTDHVTIENSIPIYGLPRRFLLNVNAPAEANGAEVELVIASNWKQLRKVVGVLGNPEGGDGSNQVFAVGAPGVETWKEGGGRINYMETEQHLRLTGVTIRRGTASRVPMTIELMSLKAETRVEAPTIRVRPPAKGNLPPQVLDVEITNLHAERLAGDLIVVLRDWDGRERGRSVGTLAEPLAPGERRHLTLQAPEVPSAMNAAFYEVSVEGACLPYAVDWKGRTSWTRLMSTPLKASRRRDLPWGLVVCLERCRRYLDSRRAMEELAALARDTGAKWSRESFGYFRLNEMGETDWAMFDERVRLLNDAGINTIMMTHGLGCGYSVFAPGGRTAYSNQVAALVRRYYPRGVADFEIWNEPNLSGFWPGPIDLYPKVLADACGAAHGSASSANVLATSTSRIDLPLIRKCASVPFGGVSVHPYRTPFVEQTFIDDIAKTSETVGGRDVWITEMGWSTCVGECSERDQAALYARAYLTALACPKLRALCAYNLVDDGWNPRYREENFGIMRYDYAPKPAYRAVAKVFRTFSDGKPIVRNCSIPGGTLWAIRMNGKLAVWSDTGRMTRIAFDEDVLLTNLMDEPCSFERVGGKLVVSIDESHPIFADAIVRFTILGEN